MYVGLAFTVISVSAHHWEIVVIRQAGPHLLSKWQGFAFPFWILLCGFQKAGKEANRWVMEQTENGIRLLATQKPTKRPGWWERKLALFWIPATGAGGGYRGGGVCLSRGQLPAAYIQPVGRSFYRLREVAICRNSTVSSNSHREIGHQWIGQRHLDCFKYG